MTVTFFPGDMVYDTFERYYEDIKFEDSLLVSLDSNTLYIITR